MLKNIYAVAITLVLGNATNALAAAGRHDTSGIVVWAFLGFCALIVVAQLIPAALVLFGFAKGIAGKPVPKEARATAGPGDAEPRR